jgi:hypothetical protein
VDLYAETGLKMAQKNIRRGGKCSDAPPAIISGLLPETVKLLVGGY